MVKIGDENPVYPLTNLNWAPKIEVCRLAKSSNYTDLRGSFRKIRPISDDLEINELPICQVNLSANNLAGTIRGLHYQVDPFLESKLVSCIKGSVFDVVLDMRPTSETYGKYTHFNLSPYSGILLVPPLVAHGFQTLEDDTTLLYLHSNDYSPNNSHGVQPLDPDLEIIWPLPIRSMSESDRNLPVFSEVRI